MFFVDYFRDGDNVVGVKKDFGLWLGRICYYNVFLWIFFFLRFFGNIFGG